MFLLDPTTQVEKSKLKSNIIYKLLKNKIYAVDQTGTRKWNKVIPMNNSEWTQLLKSTVYVNGFRNEIKRIPF